MNKRVILILGIAAMILLGLSLGLAQKTVARQAQPIPTDQIRPVTPPLAFGAKDYCFLDYTNWTPYWYYRWWKFGDKVAIYFDPEDCDWPQNYPFQLTDVEFVLHDYAIVDSVDVRFSVEVMCPDICDGPGIEIWKSDVYTITTFYPDIIQIIFPDTVCLDKPFFFNVEYMSDYPEEMMPSLLWDSLTVDTCYQWVWTGQPAWWEWYDFWPPHPPPDPPSGWVVLGISGYVADQADCGWWYWKPDTTEAPSGMPDFDQNQPGWSCYCGPTAVANCLWWFNAVPPGWTPPQLIDTLARYFHTNPSWGTYVDTMQMGLEEYFADYGFALKETTYWMPDFYEMEDSLKVCQDIILLIGFWWYEEEWQEFIRGDVDENGLINIQDYVACMNGPPFSCDDAADVNDDGVLDALDCEYLYNYLFSAGPPPPPPFPDCGLDPTPDALGCADFPPCPGGGGDWWREGGHYVTMAGVNSEKKEIAISDPDRDRVVQYPWWPGRVRTADHLPWGAYGPTYHNNTQYVSHDVYISLLYPEFPSPGSEVWDLADYCYEAYKYSNMNVPERFRAFTKESPKHYAYWHTEVDAAVMICPIPGENHPPEIIQPDTLYGYKVCDTVVYGFSGTDPDGDPILDGASLSIEPSCGTYSVTRLTGHGSSSGTWEVTWDTKGCQDSIYYKIIVDLTDDQGNTSWCTTYCHLDPNHPPVIDQPDFLEGYVDSVVEYDITGTDPDGDDIEDTASIVIIPGCGSGYSITRTSGHGTSSGIWRVTWYTDGCTPCDTHMVIHDLTDGCNTSYCTTYVHLSERPSDSLWYWKPDTTDAPSGMPDFDQYQFGPPDSFGMCGPTAVANCLWWFGAVPTTVDDPGDFIRLLSDYFNTDPTYGTYVDSIQEGLDRYFEDYGFALKETTYWEPDFYEMEDSLKVCQDIILLLGFWYYDIFSEEWYREGGHFVTMAGVCSESLKIAISDPARDAAVGGWPGRVRPPTHPPAGTYPPTLHNNPLYVSHDMYQSILDPPFPSPGNPFWEIDYPWAKGEFSGMNVPERFRAVTKPAPEGGKQIFATEVEAAIMICPKPEEERECDENDPKECDTLWVECGNMLVPPGGGLVTVDLTIAHDESLMAIVVPLSYEGNPECCDSMPDSENTAAKVFAGSVVPGDWIKGVLIDHQTKKVVAYAFAISPTSCLVPGKGHFGTLTLFGDSCCTIQLDTTFYPPSNNVGFMDCHDPTQTLFYPVCRIDTCHIDRNYPPVIGQPDFLEGFVDDVVQYDITGTDPDGDAIEDDASIDIQPGCGSWNIVRTSGHGTSSGTWQITWDTDGCTPCDTHMVIHDLTDTLGATAYCTTWVHLSSGRECDENDPNECDTLWVECGDMEVPPGGGLVTVNLTIFNDEVLQAIQVPLSYQGSPVCCDSMPDSENTLAKVFAGSRVENWELNTINIDHQNKTITLTAVPISQPPLQPGKGHFATLTFFGDSCCTILLDTTFTPPLNTVQFVTPDMMSFYPVCRIDTCHIDREEVGWHWKDPYEDYAPNGMPDIDQKQDGWRKLETEQWSFCGPAAVANCFKWFDSKYNDVAPGFPGDGIDQFPLVRDYLDDLGPLVGYDDHDPWNVDHVGSAWGPAIGPPPPTLQPFVPGPQMPGGGLPPWGELVERLAWYFDTDGIQSGYCNHTGTNILQMQQGIQDWLDSEMFPDSSTLADTLCQELTPMPTFAYVESLVEKCEDVILLLGFWFEDPPGSGMWFRIGGHYVTVAGVNSERFKIAFSDPFIDNAEFGAPGRVGDGTIIPHDFPHDPTVHNDEGNVSHDIYDVEIPSNSPGGEWWLPGYAINGDPGYWVWNFHDQNVPEEFEPMTAQWNGTSPIHTEVEYCVHISPWDYRGDANGDGIVNVGDIVFLVSYLYKNGPPPVPVSEGDVNCDGIVNVGDIVFLVSYLYRNGPVPRCCDP